MEDSKFVSGQGQRTKVLITGGPATGKTSIIQKLESVGHTCYPEISRKIIQDAQKEGIPQLFLEDPLKFSEKLLDGRREQFRSALRTTNNDDLWSNRVFMDRGIPDIIAYMHYAQAVIPRHFNEACSSHRYDQVFILPPWEQIYVQDQQRYETFEESKRIHKSLVMTYQSFGYSLIEVPMGSIAMRCEFILNHSESH